MRRLLWLSVIWFIGIVGMPRAVPTAAVPLATVASTMTVNTQTGPGSPGPFWSA